MFSLCILLRLSLLFCVAPFYLNKSLNLRLSRLSHPRCGSASKFQGFDEYMNLVLDEAGEANVKKKIRNPLVLPSSRLGRFNPRLLAPNAHSSHPSLHIGPRVSDSSRLPNSCESKIQSETENEQSRIDAERTTSREPSPLR